MKEENEGQNDSKKSYRKMWIAIIIAIIFLLIGFYLYYFYPKMIPGMASLSDDVIEENRQEESIQKETIPEPVPEPTREPEPEPVSEPEPAPEPEAEPVLEPEPEPEPEPVEEVVEEIKEEDDKSRVEEVEKKQDIIEQPVRETETQEEEEIITELLKKEERVLYEESEELEPEKEQDRGIIESIKEGISNLAQNIKEGVTDLVIPTLKEDINILVVGFDDAESVTEGKISADALVLVKLHPQNQKLELSNIIINERRFVFNEDFDKKEINSLLYEIEGVTLTKIDYYFSLSYQGFIKLIDNLGGIEIMVQNDLKVPALDLDLKTGKHILNGQTALSYSRWFNWRKDEKDRISRQQQVISAMINKAYYDKSILDLPQLFRTTIDAVKMVKTDLEYSLITRIFTFLKKTDELEVSYRIISER
jgi:polyisoprenyl-teichoic acid--peptidoglycan teichoic acid transferase